MNRDKLKTAIAEAGRFIAAASVLLGTKVQTFQSAGEYRPAPWSGNGAPVQQGATRRASLDLTRALADLRRPL